MFHESKYAIYSLIPQHYYPATIFIKGGTPFEQALQAMVTKGITYPFIAKPDRGERGLGVMKICSSSDLQTYMEKMPVDFIIQEYVDYPLEFSVFYVRHPLEKRGKITSITFKDLLKVTGDGKTSIEGLVMKNDRAFLQLEKLKKERHDLHHVLALREERILVPYGNHSRGTRFEDCCNLIDEQLTTTFDTLSHQIEGFYYGRYDLRTTSIEEMRAGRNIAILELNGAKAEVAHIYNPRFSFLKAQWVIMTHFKLMWQIAMHNKNTSPFISFSTFLKGRREEAQYKRRIRM